MRVKLHRRQGVNLKVHLTHPMEVHRSICGAVIASPIVIKDARPMNKVCAYCCLVALRLERLAPRLGETA